MEELWVVGESGPKPCIRINFATSDNYLVYKAEVFTEV